MKTLDMTQGLGGARSMLQQGVSPRACSSLKEPLHARAFRPESLTKKTPAPLLALSIVVLLSLCGYSFSSVNPKLQLMNATISEVPALPGHVVALTLQFKSIESDNCADHISVQVAVSYPLSVQGPDTQYANSLCTSEPDSAGTFTFLLPVDNLATSGTYPVAISTAYEKRYSKFTESNTVNVRVGGSPAFSAAITSSSPVDIYPGDSADVTVTFQNTGPTQVTSARAHALSSGIQTKWSGQDQTLGSIAARGSTSATFAIEAPKDLAPGEYPLNVRLDYTGEDRQNGTDTFRFIVPIKPKAEFEARYSNFAPCIGACPTVLAGNVAPLRAGASQDAVITLTNTGHEEARKLKVRIRPLFPFSTDGTVRYVDSLKPGRSLDLTYTITVDKDATSGAQMCGLAMEFEDPAGKKFSDSADFSLPVRPSTVVENLEAYMPLVYLVVLVAAVSIVRRALGAMNKKQEKK